MMTFKLDDGRIVRLRQRKLQGPFQIAVLGAETDVHGCHRVVEEFSLPPKEMADFLALKVCEHDATKS